MNIITNCCLGGFITRDVLHEQFSNPFVWVWMTTNDVCNIVHNYSSLDFRKFIIRPHDGQLVENCCFDIIVDNQITLVYSHYQFNSNYPNEFIDRTRNIVISDHIWEYVVKKYVERVKRMEILNEQPVFLICDNRNGCGTFTTEQVNDLSQHSKYKIVFCSEIDYSDKANQMFYFVKKHGNLLNEIISEYGDDIKNFLTNDTNVN